MICTVPPPLTFDQIMSVLDGEAELATQRHLEQCPSCRHRVEEEREWRLRDDVDDMEILLRRYLFRATCPTPQELGEFHLEMLDDEVANPIQHHLNICPHCQAELNQLQEFLQDDTTFEPHHEPPVPKLLTRLGDLVAQFIPSKLDPAYRGSGGKTHPVFRGATPEPLTFEANGVTIFLDIETTTRGYALRGQLIVDESNHAQWVHAMVEIRQSGDVQSVCAIDDMRMFLCEITQKSPMDLRIVSVDGQRILIKDIDFDG